MGIGIAKYEMWIFDRWGAKIFYTDDIRKGWNGKVTGKTNEVQQDVYVYKVKLVDVLGKKHDYVGHVTVVKGQ
jgi:gliding motility-associated-like protein